MLLQPTTPKLVPICEYKDHSHFCFSNSISLSSGPLKDSAVCIKKSILSTSYNTRENPFFIQCSSISKVPSYGTVDYENRPMVNWSAIYKKISMSENPNASSSSVLNQVENEGKNLSKWELCRIVKELRKFKRYRFALEVYEWMNNRAERFRITSSDTAIQLDLIAKVHGIPSAEQYFLQLPDALKDKRIYGSLLNVYVRSQMREKSESLMDKMRNRGYARDALPYNVMMTLYMNLKDHDQIESVVSEMKEKNVAFDVYTYNIWLSSSGSQGSLEKMEQVFYQMQLDPRINPSWATFSTMASMYIRVGHFEKAEECLRNLESRIKARDRMPYHYLISLYATAGKREEVYRVWKIYKASFPSIPNSGYVAMTSALVRLDDISGAEKIYDEWLTVKSMYEPRLGNLLLGSYVKKELSQKVEAFFNQMLELGGKPNAMTWEILAEDHIQNRRIPEALSCLQNAASAEGTRKWKPKASNVVSILKISQQEADTATRDVVFELLRQVDCLGDESYMSYINLKVNGVVIANNIPELEVRTDISGDNNDETYGVLDQLQESL